MQCDAHARRLQCKDWPPAPGEFLELYAMPHPLVCACSISDSPVGGSVTLELAGEMLAKLSASGRSRDPANKACTSLAYGTFISAMCTVHPLTTPQMARRRRTGEVRMLF